MIGKNNEINGCKIVYDKNVLNVNALSADIVSAKTVRQNVKLVYEQNRIDFIIALMLNNTKTFM